jgi:serine/threonine-protein kinase
MRPEHSTAAHLADRFEREARALARLRHPNIVTLFDAGRANSGSSFIVMELVLGVTLRRELRRGGVPPALFVAWFDQILDAVGYAHRPGDIHRDLKPENILLATTEDGPRVAKVLDFGLAKFGDAGSDVTALTKTGAVLGTLAYMAPEQLLGRAVDERSDVFALGTIAAEAVSGRHPFRYDNVERTAVAILNDPIRLSGDDPQIRALEAALARATSKRRADRYPTIEAFRAEVIAVMRECPPLPAVVGSPDGTIPGIDDLGRGVDDRRKASNEDT